MSFNLHGFHHMKAMGWPHLPSICIMPSWSPQGWQAALVAVAWPGMYDIFCLRGMFLFHDWPLLAFKRFTLYQNRTPLLRQNEKLLG